MKTLKRMDEAQRLNKALLFSYSLLAVSLSIAYVLEFLKGNRTGIYTLIFLILNMTPYFVSLWFYQKDRNTDRIKFIFSIGFSILYIFVLFTAAVPTAFVYILLALFIIIPYGDLRLCLVMGGTAAVVNLVSITFNFQKGSLTTADMAMVEIQLISTIYAVIFTAVATIVIGRANAQKVEEVRREKEKAEELLANTLELAERISGNIDVVYGQMNRLEEAVEITKNSMYDVSEGARETAESMQDQLSRTGDIMNLADKVREVSQVIDGDVEETKRAILTGKENLELLLCQVSQSEMANTIVALKMEELMKITEKMNSILEMIYAVTRKTNLLSLNASIEAARAGEAGRGFGVVAGEISGLANQTDLATTDITKLIGEIGISIKDAVKATNQLVENNRKQNQSAESMVHNFKKIEECTRNVGEVSVELGKAVETLTEANHQIVGSINGVSAITQEVSARAGETLSVTEGNSKVVEEITRVMEELNKEAKGYRKREERVDRTRIDYK